MAVQNSSMSCGVTTIVVTLSSRSASKMTRGLRERTYSTSAPIIVPYISTGACSNRCERGSSETARRWSRRQERLTHLDAWRSCCRG